MANQPIQAVEFRRGQAEFRCRAAGDEQVVVVVLAPVVAKFLAFELSGRGRVGVLFHIRAVGKADDLLGDFDARVLRDAQLQKGLGQIGREAGLDRAAVGVLHS